MRAQRQLVRRARRLGLGYPILPDSFNVASGGAWGFSPQTPDAIIMQVLQQQGQQLPPDLAAKWAAARLASAPAVNPQGQPVSTQTGQGLRLVSSLNIAQGVYQCLMSDGSTHYCDVDGNPITYTPPASATTPAAGSTAVVPVAQPQQPAQSGYVPSTPPAPLYLGPPLQAPGSTPTAPPPSVAVTPGGTPISTTTATPVPQPASSPSSGFDLSAIMSWFQGSMFAGIPNWAIVGVGALILFSSEGGGRSRRR